MTLGTEFHVQSGADGTFRLGTLAEGDYALTAATESAGSAAAAFVHAPATGVRLVVTPLTRVTLRLVVADDVTLVGKFSVGECAADAAPNRVRANRLRVTMRPGATPRETVVTATVSRDARALWICNDQGAPVVVPFAPRAGELTDIGEVRVNSGLTFRGRVVAQDGSPVGGAEVEARIAPYMRWTTKSAADGTFALAHLAAGPAAVYAQADGQFGAAVVDVSADAPRSDVRLRVVGTLKGLVRGPDGAPVAGVAVSVRHWFVDDADGDGRSLPAVTDAEGRFAKAVAPGRCLVSAGGDSVRADVPEGGEAAVTVTTR
jgi:hypothetical protein